MTKMLSLLEPREINELRDYLERCVEGLEEGASAEREATPPQRRTRRSRGEPRTAP